MVKRIGILANKSENVFGVAIPYLELFDKYGQIILIPPNREAVDVDLLVLPGGHDISSHIYGEKPSYNLGGSDPFRDWFLTNTLPQYIAKKTPIFGICLGLQQLNVVFGGKLIQHNDKVKKSSPRGELVEKVNLNVCNKTFGEYMSLLKSKGLNLKNANEYKVNSLHHQVIPWHRPNYLGKNVIPIARSMEGDLHVEAIRIDNYPAYAVQWHPEEMQCIFSNFLIQKLLRLNE